MMWSALKILPTEMNQLRDDDLNLCLLLGLKRTEVDRRIRDTGRTRVMMR
jgi:hypothetical protein